MIISSIRAVIEAITCFNESVTFLQWLRSLQSRSNGAENQELSEDDVLKLQTSLQCLEATLPVMRDLIDRAEWKIHEKCVEELLPELKATVYDAEDIVDVLRDYERMVKNEGSETSMELFHDVIQGNVKKLNHIKERLDTLSKLLKRFGIDQDTRPQFDRSVRPETSSFSVAAKIFGRDDEIKKLISLLGVPGNNSRGPSTRKRSRSNNTEATISSVPVLPIVGIGGVGKTTLVQNICSHPQVKKHFDSIVWICVSDDFDVKRLTKEAIQQFSGKAQNTNNLNSLQADLAYTLNKRRFLIVLDDMWAENGYLWKTFYAPFNQVLEGSMMLVTTRSQKVADIMRTTDPFLLEGLKDCVFQNFFKLCVFGSDSSNNNPELERIGEQILPKLKGSPLAAKTVGRLLGMSLDPAHWNMILDSQLWELRQEETDILPALRLSYMYLPFHLKRCFSFCAVYPKDYNFVKEDLAEIWVAEGFVEAEHNIPLQQSGCKYFEELAHLSFFQKFRGKYVMHDLIHDMAQLVSKDNCFIIKEKKDLERIPRNVRHLSVLKSRDLKCSDLNNLCKQTKLCTLLCNMSLKSKTGNTMMEKWCAELLCMRVMVCASISKSGLPDSISNMKNLRYLKISDAYLFDSLPATLCDLYNLQLLSARKCKVIPKGFSNLVNLQKFESEVLKIGARFHGSLFLKHYPGEYLPSWSHGSDVPTIFSSLTEITIIDCPRLSIFEQFLQPYMSSIRKMLIKNCTSLVCVPVERFGDLPSLEELEVCSCPKINSQHLLAPSLKKLCLQDSGNLGDDIDCSSLTTFRLSAYHLASLTFNGEKLPRLTDLTIEGCPELDTLNGEKLPRLTHLTIAGCPELDTLIGSWPILKSLSISGCPRLKWENGIVLPLSLQILSLNACGYFSERCFENLTSLKSLEMIGCQHIEDIPRDLWSYNLKSLQNLIIDDCEGLVSIGGPEAIAHIPQVIICNCPKLKEVQQPLVRGYGSLSL